MFSSLVCSLSMSSVVVDRHVHAALLLWKVPGLDVSCYFLSWPFHVKCNHHPPLAEDHQLEDWPSQPRSFLLGYPAQLLHRSTSQLPFFYFLYIRGSILITVFFFFFFNRKGWAFSFGTFSCESVQHSNTVRAFCEAPPTASVLPPFSLWPWLSPDSGPPFDGWTYSVTLSSEQENSDLCTSKAHSLWPAPCLWWP